MNAFLEAILVGMIVGFLISPFVALAILMHMYKDEND